MTARLSKPLSDFVVANVGEHNNYKNVSEYMRDLIHYDKSRNLGLPSATHAPA